MNTILVLCFILFLKRRLWSHPWFWVTMAVVALLHIPLILFVPWGTKWVPALVFAGIDTADFCLIIWIFVLLGKFLTESETLGFNDR